MYICIHNTFGTHNLALHSLISIQYEIFTCSVILSCPEMVEMCCGNDIKGFCFNLCRGLWFVAGGSNMFYMMVLCHLISSWWNYHVGDGLMIWSPSIFLLVIIPFIQVVTRGFGITPRTNMPKKITYQQFPQWNSEDLLINDENILKQHILPNYKSCQHESHHRKTICSLNHLSPPMLMRTLMILM